MSEDRNRGATLVVVYSPACNTGDHLARELAACRPDWQVETISSTAGLLSCVKRNKVDCILVCASQKEAHVKLYEGLRRMKECAVVPVILVASSRDRRSIRDAIAPSAGTDVFVLQEEVEDLAAAVESIVRVRRAEQELRLVNYHLAEVVEERSRTMHEYDERYRFLIEFSGDAVLELERDTVTGQTAIITMNDTACSWIGYTREDMARLSLRQLFAPGAAEEMIQMLEGVLQHKELHFETVALARDRSRIPLEVFMRAFEVDKKLRVLVVARKAAPHVGEAGEGNADDEYGFLVSQTGQMIYDGNIHTQRMAWGGAVEQISGFSLRQMNQAGMRGWRERIVPGDYHRVMATVNEAIQSVGKYEVEYRFLHKSGEQRHIEDHGVVLPDHSGSACRIMGTMKDITEKKRQEEQRQRLEIEIQHSQRLESLGVLAGGIAHDFNNILAGIIGLTDLAIREIPADSFAHEDLTEVLQAANRAKELVRQILAFSRQSGQERNPIYLHMIAREVIKLLRASLPPTIEIIDSTDVHSGAIMANAAQMYQVITNFSTNAAQAMMGKPGKIEVRVNDMEVDEPFARCYPSLKPGSYVRLSVRDTGHGMAPAVLARAFDPFFTTKGPGEGTGMGLAVVHGIVTDHGGVVMAESELGVGSTFDVYLPRIAGVVVEEEESHERLQHGYERILFVDDDEAVLRFAESALPRLGFRVTLCRNGEDALTTFINQGERFDLIITDQMMPRMSGEELARQIHLQCPAIPVILFTGFSEEISRERLEACGIYEVVLKPIIIKDLVDTIRRVLDRAEDEREGKTEK